MTKASMEVPLIDRLLALPPVKGSEYKPKREPVKPDLSKLNEDQRTAFENVFSQCINGPQPMHLIQGYAGTGKTFLTGYIIEQLLCDGVARIGVAAPTNKAVQVISEACEVRSTRLEFNTVHSFLGLREKIDENGNQTFVQMRPEDAKMGGMKVMILDEGSMLPDELFNYLNNYTSNAGISDLKLIIIGDPAQIPPIGKTDCIPFISEERERYNIGLSVLRQIVRQAADNPLIALSMRLRDKLQMPFPLPAPEDVFDPITLDGVYFMDVSKEAEFIALLDCYFNSPNFKANSDFCKIVGWRNDSVNKMNRLVRKLIYGKGIPKLCIGERLIADKPIAEGEGRNSSIIFNTNDEFYVHSYEVKEVALETKLEEPLVVQFYDTWVIPNGKTENEKELIAILHEDSEELFNGYLDYLKEIAKSRKAGWEKSQAWTEYYRFSETFAQVKYAYAITGHKSQGSTYDNAFVLSGDIDANRKVVERNRIRYTAFTRPRHKLFVIE